MPQDFDLSSVSLHYDAEWPLSIVLNSKALGVYNSVFSFLLRIKRALWCLQRITAKQLSEAADNCRHFVAELERDNEMFLLDSSLADRKVILSCTIIVLLAPANVCNSYSGFQWSKVL